MPCESRTTRAPHMILTLLLGLAMMLTPIAPAAHAQPAADDNAVSVAAWDGQAVEPSAGIERWWGVAGAALCAFEIRLVVRVPVIGMNPYAIAAGLAGCLLAAVDILSTK